MLEPSIPLSIQPPQIQNPLEVMAKLQAYRNAQQQYQMGGIELQRAKQAQQDDEYTRKIMAQYGGNIGLALPSLAGNISTPALLALQSHFVDLKTKDFAMQKTANEVADQVHETFGELALGVKKAGSTPDAFNAAVDSALKLAPTPQARQQVADKMAPYLTRAKQDPSSIAQIVEEIGAGTKVWQKDQEVNAAVTTAESRKRTADIAEKRLGLEAPGIEARGELSQKEVAGQAPIQPYQQKQLDIAEQTRALAETREQREAKQAQQNIALAQGRLDVERGNAARMQKQFDATYGALLGPNGEQLSPEAMKAIAQQDPMAVAVANYQLPPPAAGRSGPGAATLRKVMAINPTYNAQNWQAQSAMNKGYTSGSQSKEISGINTALGHVGVLGEAIDALNNGNIQALNRIANFLNVQTGGDAVTTFKTIVHKVAPEINRAYVGGVGSQGEIQAQESDFDPKLGDKQLRANVAITAKLLRSKIGSLENQWQNTMGSDFESKFIMPEAKAVADKWAPRAANQQQQQQPGGGAGTPGSRLPTYPVPKVFTVKDPRGVVHTFATQQAADAFQKALDDAAKKAAGK